MVVREGIEIVKGSILGVMVLVCCLMVQGNTGKGISLCSRGWYRAYNGDSGQGIIETGKGGQNVFVFLTSSHNIEKMLAVG